MGTVPTPYSWIAGDDATQPRMQTLSDSALYMLGSSTSGGSKKAVVELRQTVAQSIPTGTWTDMLWDLEDADYDNSHSTVTNTARLTAATPGWLILGGAIDWAANASATRRGARWATSISGGALTPINAAQNVVPGVASLVCTAVARSIKVFLGVGDYVTLQGFQDTGGALLTNVTAAAQSSLSALWVSN